jgi:isopenicillin N synthase-like dioxygenase
VLRLLHYPPIPKDATGVRAGAHGDINTITLLMGAEEGGLELLDRNGDWLPINPPPGCVVCNIGDMLERLTNHVLPSTIHRVVNPPPERRGVPRYSTPFFLHFASDYLIKTLPSCVTEENPDRYPEPITADAFLQQRLREIKLAWPRRMWEGSHQKSRRARRRGASLNPSKLRRRRPSPAREHRSGAFPIS